MVYFFHHYELPAVEQQAQVHSLIALAQRQQTPQHLLTVMTRTAAGGLARTTADISEFRPVIDSAAEVHRDVDNPPSDSASQIHCDVDNPQSDSEAEIHRDVDNPSVGVLDVHDAAVQPNDSKVVGEPCDHKATGEPSVDQAAGEPSVHKATGECNSQTNSYQWCDLKTNTTEYVDDDLTQSVCRVPQSATDNPMVRLHDSMVQSTTSDIDNVVCEESVCTVDR